jgi:hypothetical protein
MTMAFFDASSRMAMQLTSNAVDVDILTRDADWEKQQLAQVLGKMSTRENGGSAEACQALSYLESKDADLAMAKNTAPATTVTRASLWRSSVPAARSSRLLYS